MKKRLFSLIVTVGVVMTGLSLGNPVYADSCTTSYNQCISTCNSDACMESCGKNYVSCSTGVDLPQSSGSEAGIEGGSNATIPKSGKLNLVPKKLGEEAGFNTGGESLTITVANIIKSFMGLLGIVVVGIIVYAGFLWMTASGNEEKVGMAKRMITQATIGLILILLAYSIADFIITAAVEGTTGVKVDAFQ